jgi:hypothetical protein
MDWKHYEHWQRGSACLIIDGEDHESRYDLGEVSTGRQRVFHRYYVRLFLPDGSHMIGEDAYGLRAALFDLDRQLQDRDMVLLVAGLEPNWSESGLSFNSGFGYLAHCDHGVHMMDAPPPRDRNPDDELFVEELIRVAVDGMLSSKLGCKTRSV